VTGDSSTSPSTGTVLSVDSPSIDVRYGDSCVTFLSVCRYSPFADSLPIAMNITMTELKCPGCGLGASGAMILCAMLPKCQSLTRLDISNNHLRSGGGSEVSKFLVSNPTQLTYLNVANNYLNRNWINLIERSSSMRLACAVHACPGLELDISGNEDFSYPESM
jgi:hypothetical protein